MHIVETSLPPGLDVLDLAPVASEPHVWVVLGTDGRLLRLDCAAGDWLELGRVELQEEPDHEPWFGRLLTPRVHVSTRGDFVAVVNDYASLGAVYDARTTARTLELDGGNYHRETVPLSFAFVDRGARTLVVHRTAWNRLDVSDAATGELLTARQPTSFTRGEPMPPHYLDYFHGRLFVSTDGSRILDDGWVWHPVGIPCVWDLRAWLDSNVWESEDGSTRLCLAVRDHYWDHAMCWLDSDRVAIGGIGGDDEDMTAGARIFVAAEAAARPAPGQWPFARELTAFAGPGGELFGDGDRLFSADDDGLSVWDVESGARIARVDGFRPTRQHRAGRELVELSGSALRRWQY